MLPPEMHAVKNLGGKFNLILIDAINIFSSTLYSFVTTSYNKGYVELMLVFLNNIFQSFSVFENSEILIY